MAEHPPTGGRVVVVEHQADGSLGRMASWLEGSGVEIELVRPYLGDPIPAALEADGLVVLGAVAGAYDDDVAPWLPAVRQLMSDAVDSEVPVLGICLGAQLLAVATGGRVVQSTQGLEVGVIEIEQLQAADGDPLLSDLPAQFPNFSFHYDEVAELPRDAVLLARSRDCETQAFRVGPSAWGLQFHPEVEPDAFMGWMNEYSGSVDHDQRQRIADAVQSRDEQLTAASSELAERFARVVVARSRR